MSDIKLTSYSKGSGCGCKIAPTVLQQILGSGTHAPDAKLLVGNSTSDDAAAYDLGNGQALISTTDFFTPIVDDAYDFGRIAAANALSDVYAMGGQPTLALAILGWPIESLGAELAGKVLAGARAMCAEAGIVLAGGHSIDISEPIFGLAVSGLVDVASLKRNSTAQAGDLLYITKPIGVGILAAAQKRGAITPEDEVTLIDNLTKLNKIGFTLGQQAGVTAMTDVTGFGLAGHLVEMAEGAGLSAVLNYGAVPKLASTATYIAQNINPDATFRNWNGYSSKVKFETGVDVMQAFKLLPDPQTNGGMLIAVRPEAKDEVAQLLKDNGYGDFAQPIGSFVKQSDQVVMVEA